jgi:hypothetical protein
LARQSARSSARPRRPPAASPRHCPLARLRLRPIGDRRLPLLAPGPKGVRTRRKNAARVDCGFRIASRGHGHRRKWAARAVERSAHRGPPADGKAVPQGGGVDDRRPAARPVAWCPSKNRASARSVRRAPPARAFAAGEAAPPAEE